MRVLFLTTGTMWTVTLPEGFKEAGHEIMISGSIGENNIEEMVSKFKPDLIMSIGWGENQSVENQILTRKNIQCSKTPHVYWSLEDPLFTDVFTIPLLKRVQPDFVFTICPQSIKRFSELGFKAAYMDFGFASDIHCSVECEEQYKCSIAVVANAYPEVLEKNSALFRNESIKTLILPLLKEGYKVDFWGKDWDKINNIIGFDIPKEWIHGYIPYIDANKIYNSTNIMIGLQNYNTQVTQRTYEILASGGFLLTSDTPALRGLFKSGEHLVLSSSPQQTLKLIKYYLSNPDKRKIIAAAGQKIINGHSYRERALYILEVLKKEGII